jgi:IgA peptidase M64
MGAGDGAVVSTTKIRNHGAASDRWNLVIVSEGYQEGEIPQFHSHAGAFVAALLGTPPFSDVLASGPLSNAINVFRIDVKSTDSGADDPTECGGTGATPATFFDASFCNYGVQRLLLVDQDAVLDVVDRSVPEHHAIVVLVNSTIYGGSGGAIAVASLAAGANELALHELGHSPFGLADEYEYYLGCGVDVDRDVHPATEPAEPNVTIDDTAATKWPGLITTGVPTTTNANCTVCDPLAVDPGGVGTFEGAHYYHCKAYRPQFNCRMRALGHGFCAVCQERIRQTLTPFLP